MIIDDKTVRDIAQLARLELTNDEQVQIKEDMNSVLDWMQKLNELDTSNVKPLIHMSYETNVLRQDEEKEGLEHDRALINAPKKDSNYFRVPKVID